MKKLKKEKNLENCNYANGQLMKFTRFISSSFLFLRQP